ncbi:5-oxoprolinase subunit PxpA [Sandaracinus amylolyticus]|uniref:Lactam utilization protein LamB n=1 Tax=Sandaracinus amylolyticus TaxID=927083 RepID=A0A0F6SG70_9BACT|nr:5-oxoprolinase subunit PxpA [Sandaracinus amylolyticus]AKF08179.1 Lactam utilization protein LamB [Sandaracinus amylolyticus]
MRPLLNVDAGEMESEPEALWAIAHALNVACGGHAGDARSMERVLRACREHHVRAGAHPSYPDREGFGRRRIALATEALETSIAAQCRALRVVAERVGIAIEHAKLHGALYHDAAKDPSIAAACVRAIRAELGPVAILGPGDSALEHAARGAGGSYEREGFADRGMRADGSLIPRGQPGALIEDPVRAAGQARALATSGDVDTICVHGDTPGALAIARAVRETLDALGTS